MKTYTVDKYIKHYAEEGMVLTEWNEGDDILDFTYCKIAICPLNKECNYREITEEQNNIYLQKQQEEFELRYGRR